MKCTRWNVSIMKTFNWLKPSDFYRLISSNSWGLVGFGNRSQRTHNMSVNLTHKSCDSSVSSSKVNLIKRRRIIMPISSHVRRLIGNQCAICKLEVRLKTIKYPYLISVLLVYLSNEPWYWILCSALNWGNKTNFLPRKKQSIFK